MNRSAKILVLLVSLSLCAIGGILSPKENAKESEPKTQIVPVNNHQSQRGVWLRV
jgi:hypothetical protein